MSAERHARELETPAAMNPLPRIDTLDVIDARADENCVFFAADCTVKEAFIAADPAAVIDLTEAL